MTFGEETHKLIVTAPDKNGRFQDSGLTSRLPGTAQESWLAGNEIYTLLSARHEEHGAVMVKIFDGDDTTRRQQRFDAEIKRLSSLAAIDGFPVVLDTGVTNEAEPFIAMKAYGQITLQQMLDTDGPQPWVGASPTFQSLCQSVAAMNQAGLYHGAVRPSIVHLDNSSIAGQQRITLAESTYARDAASLGLFDRNSAFSAPEVVQGQNPTARSDVYSLAMTLGTVLSGDPTRPVPKHVPRRINTAIDRATAAEPALRPANVETLMAAIFGTDEPTGSLGQRYLSSDATSTTTTRRIQRPNVRIGSGGISWPAAIPGDVVRYGLIAAAIAFCLTAAARWPFNDNGAVDATLQNRQTLSVPGQSEATTAEADNSVAVLDLEAQLSNAGGELTLNLGPGVHTIHGPTNLDGIVEIVGSGRETTILRLGRDPGAIIHVIAGSTSLRDLVLEGTSPSEGDRFPALHISSGQANLERVEIRDSSGPGILIDGAGQLTGSDVNVERSGQEGIKVTGTSTVDIERFHVRNSALDGIRFMDQSEGSVAFSTTRGSGGNGFSFVGTSSAEVTSSFAIGDERNGFFVTESSQPKLSQNSASWSAFSGYYWDTDRAIFAVDNTSTRSEGYGFTLDVGFIASDFRGNQSAASVDVGFYLVGSGTGTIENNLAADGESDGFLLGDFPGDYLFRNNESSSNAGSGFRVPSGEEPDGSNTSSNDDDGRLGT